MSKTLTLTLKAFALSVVFATIFALGQTEVRADEVFIAGNTNGCFAVGPCVPSSTGGVYEPGIILAGLQYNNATFSGTTAGGFLAFGGNPVPFGLNQDNFGAFSLAGSLATYTGNSFTLRVTFTDPQGFTGSNSTLLTATLTGQVFSTTNGGVFIDFNNAPTFYTFNDAVCGPTTIPGQQTTCGSGSFSLVINDLAINPGQTASLTGQITGATQTAVPEPMTLLLLGTGLSGVAAAVRRRRQHVREEG